MSVQQKQPEQEEELVIDVEEPEQSDIVGAEAVLAEAKSVASSLDVDDFTAPRSDLNHGHDMDKHDVRSAFNVTDELVADYFHYAPNDHAALHELLARKEEFISSETPVFSDTHDANSARWRQIESRAESAPVPDKTHRTLSRM